MDLCALEDAFPNIQEGSLSKSESPFVGGKDRYATREERRAARKKAKRVKGPALDYSNLISADIPDTDPDPDRPSVERMKAIDTIQAEKEAFALPVLPKASCLYSDTGTPKYFGKWTEDDVEEGFSTFSPSPTDDSNYRLYPDFTKGEALKGAAKAAGTLLPEPPLSDTWKPMSPPTSYTSFFTELPAVKPPVIAPKINQDWSMVGSSSKGPSASNDNAINGNNQDALMKRIDELIGRIDQLEKKKVQDSQTEILVFVGTGLFILMSFDIVTRF